MFIQILVAYDISSCLKVLITLTLDLQLLIIDVCISVVSVVKNRNIKLNFLYTEIN